MKQKKNFKIDRFTIIENSNLRVDESKLRFSRANLLLNDFHRPRANYIFFRRFFKIKTVEVALYYKLTKKKKTIKLKTECKYSFRHRLLRLAMSVDVCNLIS